MVAVTVLVEPGKPFTAPIVGPPWCRNGPLSVDVLVAVADRRSPPRMARPEHPLKAGCLWRRPGADPAHGMDGRPPGAPAPVQPLATFTNLERTGCRQAHPVRPSPWPRGA